MQPADSLALPDQQSLLSVIELAGGFQWPILAVFVLGLVVLMTAVVRLTLDRRASAALRKGADPGTLDHIDPHASLYHTIASGLLDRRALGASSDALESAVGKLASPTKEAYARIHRVTTYCSATAGGLGLMGTLVGMLLSFRAAGTDPQGVLMSVSLALVSTLLGLAASIILEACDVVVARWASIQVTSAEEWGVQLCLRLTRN